MKKPKKLAKLIPKRRKKELSAEEQLIDPSVPRITNETVAEHREEVLAGARKYIYPLQHSKHKIVLISTALFIATVIAFFTYTTIALYRLKSNTGFLYGVTKVIPFPVAKAGPDFVSYENYLFELRHYVHYYESQQKLDFNTDLGKKQLANYKKRALQRVVDDAYVKQLARKNQVSVSDKELNAQIAIVRSQNRLGSNEKGFEDVLRDNFGWTVNDFKRSLKQEMLTQKVVAVLDKNTQNQAKDAMSELKSGVSFDKVAAKYSQDKRTANSGGDYGFLVDSTNRDIPAQVTEALLKLKPGQTSGIINTGYTLEIVKNKESQGKKVKGAHIVFVFKDISTYLNPLKDKNKTRSFISV